MQKQLAMLQELTNQADKDPASPVTRQATCAVFRDVLLPMLSAELTGKGIFGFIARIGIGQLKQLIERYLAQNCSTPGFQRP